MFLFNLVRLLLLVGVLYESGVDAAEHQREQPSDLRETILSLFEKFNEYNINHDTDAVMSLVHPNAAVMMDGFPPVFGQKDLRLLTELIPEKASRIEDTFIGVQAMDQNANYVYVVFHFDFYNESGDNYMDGSGLFIFRKTTDGYKFYISMYNTHNQST